MQLVDVDFNERFLSKKICVLINATGPLHLPEMFLKCDTNAATKLPILLYSEVDKNFIVIKDKHKMQVQFQFFAIKNSIRKDNGS